MVTSGEVIGLGFEFDIRKSLAVDAQGQIVYQYGETDNPGAGPGELNEPYSSYVLGDYTGQTVPPGVSWSG